MDNLPDENIENTILIREALALSGGANIHKANLLICIYRAYIEKTIKYPNEPEWETKRDLYEQKLVDFVRRVH